MSDAEYSHPHIEQDNLGSSGGNELPTYDDLANQHGPNSRFGRWRGWIEKRAAERYADITPEERARRRQRGWGNDMVESPVSTSTINQYLNPNATQVPLHVQTASLSVQDSPPASIDDASTLNVPLAFVSQPIEPSHLKINHFGSRFLPHTTAQIRCVLPLMADRILLVGHDDGLSVLDMFPQEWTDVGSLVTKGPDEAQCRPIWRGESILQMSVLESEDHGTGTPQGVVLAIVGPSQSSSDSDAPRTARMYNLTSLISLARWAIAQKGSKPLDLLHKAPNWPAPNTTSKRHKAQGSLARGIKSFIDPSSTAEPNMSYPSFQSTSSGIGQSLARSTTQSEQGSPPRQNSDDSAWDVVEDLPLRWATDFVPLAPPGSRLAGASVLSFAIWSDESRKGKGTGGQLLAIATKSNIFLYETPKGERAYRFVKEFYTPMQPRGLAFIQQSATDSRNLLDERPHAAGRHHGHKRSNSGSTLKGVVNSSSSPVPLNYGSHLSIFVAFDKKAGWIRLADSAVGEIELGEDGGPQPPGLIYSRDTYTSTLSSTSLRQRARLSFDIRESASKWVQPIRCELPIPGQDNITQPVHVLTRGKRTHILPCPLPIRSSSMPPLHAVYWKTSPKHVSARLISAGNEPVSQSPQLQLVAFSENGIEIQEMSISFMSTKGKGRAFPEETVWAEEDLGGEAGFLTMGGNWDRLSQMHDVQGLSSAASIFSVDTVDSTDILEKMKLEEGIYGWYRKDVEDWRVFWVGGGGQSYPDKGSTLDYRDSMSSMYV